MLGSHSQLSTQTTPGKLSLQPAWGKGRRKDRGVGQGYPLLWDPRVMGTAVLPLPEAASWERVLRRGSLDDTKSMRAAISGSLCAKLLTSCPEYC